ncbi:MAG: beta-phosphoglucomutase [Herbinix sp.]|jgi:beta-phosphoglucomutase|nr:beta-phosphoglucomutase [Herbinix sp.]
MNYKAFIFDLDGVICHTDKYHYQAWKSLANKLSIPFDEIKNNRLRGVSRMESLDIVLEGSGLLLSPEEKQVLAEEKNETYRALLMNMSPADLSDEVKNTLIKLRELGYHLAIGSSSKNAPLILDKIGLGEFFDVISDGNNITKSKPDPEVFLIAAEHLGIEPNGCIVVEDAIAGLEAAKAAGMKAAAIGDAAGSELADWSLNSFQDLLRIV